MKLAFTKMQGLGNDFVVIDATKHPLSLSKTQIQALADRHYGIGCDQILLVQPASNQQADFDYRIFNANGSEVEQCGNGARCVARFIQASGLSTKQSLCLATMKGLIQCDLLNTNQVKVAMGEPEFLPDAIPFETDQQTLIYSVDYDGSFLEFSALSMGNPHAVILVPNCNEAHVDIVGAFLEKHAKFPEGVNVGFMQVLSRDEIALRVFERHVGETQACGSGACAAVVAGIHRGCLDSTVKVNLPGGQLTVSYSIGGQVYLQGAAEFVFTGEISLTP